MQIGYEIAPLFDKALTGIPLYVESLLREYFTNPQEDEEWVLYGGQSAEAAQALLAERQIPILPTVQMVPKPDRRLATQFPDVTKNPAIGWVTRKIDGRLIQQLDRAALADALATVPVFHHTSVLRFHPRPTNRHIVTIYDLTTRLYPDTHSRSNIADWEEVFAFAQRSADLIIADSESAKNDVVEHLGIAAERIQAIPLGARPLPTAFTEAEKQAILSKFTLTGKRFVLSVSSLDPRKNFPRLIEAFAEICRMPEMQDVILVISGARLLGTNTVEESIAAHGMADRVRLTGYITDAELCILLKACDCFIYPSLYEGFGLPVLEAMTMGAPVITSNVSSMPEVAGDAGILIDPYSPKAITESLAVVLSDSAKATQMRLRSLERAKEFSWKRCAEAHRQAYREVSGK
jgi:glycosyltransferase involved in cell wall biosynthesis